MSVLVEYRCTGCGGRTERWVTGPVPPVAGCPACPGEARRRFGGSLGGRSATAPAAGPGGSGGDDSCLRNSGAPGICHLHPSAARRWSALGRGDTRAVEREIAHQESAIAAGTLSSGDASGHTAPG